MLRTLAEHTYKAPTKASGTPYKWANGEELWRFFGSNPEHAMKIGAGIKLYNASNVSDDAYPFREKLGKLDIKDNEVAIVGGATQEQAAFGGFCVIE